MDISILVPHKNSLSKVCRLLRSIPNDIPVVLVDDDSEDNVFEELNRIVSEEYTNAKLIKNNSLERNAGTARNVAIENCSADTEWVIFADADDEFIKGALCRLVDHLRYNESGDVVFFNSLARKENGVGKSNRCDRYRKLVACWPSSSGIIAFEWPVPWGKAIRINRVIRSNCLEFSSRVASNDMEFSAKLALTSPTINVFLEDVYICYESESSLTATLTPQKSLDRLKATINRNRLYSINNIDFVRYNYALTYLFKAIPLIIKKREFSVVGDEIRNLFIALRVNLIIRLRARSR